MPMQHSEILFCKRALHKYLHMKSSFPKRVKRHFRKCACNANAKFKECVLVKGFSHIYVLIYKRALFQNMISELDIGIETSIFGLALNAFWK